MYGKQYFYDLIENCTVWPPLTSVTLTYIKKLNVKQA